MNRLLGVAVLVVGLALGYAAGGTRVEAQGAEHANFPFSTGDTVVFHSGLRDRGDEACVVAGFRGSFVICKSDTTPFAFNLRTAIMVKLVARGAQ
jgi:hypothetical protein